VNPLDVYLREDAPRKSLESKWQRAFSESGYYEYAWSDIPLDEFKIGVECLGENFLVKVCDGDEPDPFISITLTRGQLIALMSDIESAI
jgi:hypothetical protein